MAFVYYIHKTIDNEALFDQITANFLSLSDGSASLPSLTFTSDPDTGLFLISPNNLGITVGGVEQIDISSSATTFTNPLLAPNGVVSAPAYSFSGDTDSGMYWVNATTIALAVAGVRQLNISTTKTTLQSPIIQQGSSTNGVATSVTNGIYRSGCRSFSNWTKSETATGATTYTFTLTLQTNTSSVHIADYYRIKVVGVQSNSSLNGGITMEGSVRKIASSSSVWNHFPSSYIEFNPTTTSNPSGAINTTTALTNQLIFTITTPTVIAANYNIAVDFELTGTSIIESFTVV